MGGLIIKDVEGFVLYVYSWQNGTRCRDGVEVLWCRPHLVWLVFESFIPTCPCLRLANFYVTCFGYFFYVVVY